MAAAPEETTGTPQTLTASEVKEMQQTDAAVTALTDSAAYAGMSEEERQVAALAQLDELAAQGLVKKDSIYAVSYTHLGWGKTTLLRILMGLERPTTGSVEGVGRVAAVFQEDRLCPQLNAVQNVTLVLPGAVSYTHLDVYKRQLPVS